MMAKDTGAMVRERSLPPGWYPTNELEVRNQCSAWASDDHAAARSDFVSAIVPHAGWFFSGRIAFQTLSRLAPRPDVVAVLGGHLHPQDPVRVAPEDAIATPLGVLPVDTALADVLVRELNATSDRAPDNTVEIQMPFVAYLFPGCRVLYARVPPSAQAIRVGEAIAEYASSAGLSVRVVGSTDLTHYGPNYGFVDHGRGATALEWVSSQSDRPVINSMLAMDGSQAIRLATANHSACSVGAAVAAMSFARACGVDHGTEVEYSTSYAVQPSDSFVGYVGIGFGLGR
jgi:MEMO1 family protein